MNKLLVALGLVVLLGSIAVAEDIWVNPYTRQDGTQVQGHYRSRPNAYNWDNKNYTPSQPAYNKSYYSPSRNYNSNHYKPSETRFQDRNPYNDYQPSSGYKTPTFQLPSLYDND